MLKKKIGPSGGIIVPTATLNLIKSKKKFLIKKTQSFTMGVFSEFIRKHKKAADQITLLVLLWNWKKM